MSSAERFTIALLTSAFVALAAAFAVVVPMFENYDEQTHIDRVRYTSRHWFETVGPDLRRTHGAWAAEAAVGLTDAPGDAAWAGVDSERPEYLAFGDYPGGDTPQTDDCPGPCQNYQYNQPPAWYVLNAPIAKLVDGASFPVTVLVLRLLAVLLGAPVVALAWWTAKAIWPDDPSAAIAVAAVVAGFGPLAFTVSAANNDALMLTCVFASVALMAHILRSGVTAWRALALGLVVGVGLLTKVQLTIVAPLAGLAILVARQSHISRFDAACVFALPTIAGAGWWFDVYTGSGVLTPESSEIIAPPRPGPWSDALFPVYALQRLPMLLDRMWGIYGFPIVVVPVAWRVVLWIAVFAVAAGAVVTVKRFSPRWLVVLGVPVALALSVLWASFTTYRSNGEIRGLAPRYLYPGLALYAAAAVAPLRRFLAQSRVIAFVVVGTAVIGGAGSFIRAVHGLYGTRSTQLLLDRAAVVAPVKWPLLWLALLFVAWSAAIAAIAARWWLPEASSHSEDAPL